MTPSDRLAPLLDEHGRFSVLALDHRDSLRREFDRDDPDSVARDDLVRFKLDVVEAFGDRPSAIMLDPELSIDEVLGAGRLPEGVGSLCALEAQGYLANPHVLVNHLLDGWSPQRAKQVGASAAKLLVLYRPDRGSITTSQEHLIRSVVEECAAVDLPLFVEPVPYDVIDVDDRERTVVASAERIASFGPDVIKMPFPTDADRPERWESACQRIDDAIGIPWAVLSWGAPFDIFVRQTEVACAFGCSGFMAGRAIWGDSIHVSDRAEHLSTVAIPRFEALVEATRSGHRVG